MYNINMSILTKTDVQNHLGVTIKSTLDTFISEVIEESEDYIEVLCGGGVLPRRWFDDADTEATRYYDGNGSTTILIDDLRTLTSLVVDGTTLTVNEDFYLIPYNANTDGEPYTKIKLIQPETRISGNSRTQIGSIYEFEKLQKSVVVTGTWGYSTEAPSAIKMATLRIVAQFLKDNIGDNALREQTQESLGEYSATFTKMKEVADRLKTIDTVAKYIHPDSPLRPINPNQSQAMLRKVS